MDKGLIAVVPKRTPNQNWEKCENHFPKGWGDCVKDWLSFPVLLHRSLLTSSSSLPVIREFPFVDPRPAQS